MDSKNSDSSDLHQQLSESTHTCIKRRNEYTRKCVGIAKKNLELQQMHTEKLVVLPKNDPKKLVSNYSNNKTLYPDSWRSKNVPVPVPSFQMLKSITENQQNLISVISGRNLDNIVATQ